MIEKTFKASDGKEIFYREWKGESPKGIIQIVHGMAESTNRYNQLAEFLSGKGYIVIADDHRGHGKTDSCSGYADGDMFFDTLKDVATLGEIYRKEYPTLPLFILGHSYGSFLTQAYIQRYGDKIKGAIIGGSAMMKGALITAGGFIANLGCLFGMKKKPAKLLANMSFGSYNKKFKEGTFISSILKECEIYQNCDDCGFVLSYNFYRHFFKGLKTLYKKKNYVNIDREKPILLISGREDPVGEMGASVEKLYAFYTETVGVNSVELKLYDGVRHEYFNDTSKEDAYLKVLQFCDEQIACDKEED